MPTVSCPSCSTSQTVATGADSYACSSCGASWEFVTCQTCGSRFHSRPESTGWTCPNCGTPHGSAAEGSAAVPQEAAAASPPSLAVKGDDLDSAAQEPLGGPQLPFDPKDPGSSFPMPRRAGRRGIPPWVFVAIGAVVVVSVAVYLFTRGGEDAPGDATPGAAVAAKEKLCTDINQLQVLRTDALGRAQDDLKADAVALKRADDPATAKRVRKLVTAVGDVRSALQNQEDTSAAVSAMSEAILALDC